MCAARRIFGGAPGRHPTRGRRCKGGTAGRRCGHSTTGAALRARLCGHGTAGAAPGARHCGRGTAAGALRYSSTNLACTPYCSLMVLKSSAGSSSAAPSALSNEAFERMTIELL